MKKLSLSLSALFFGGITILSLIGETQVPEKSADAIGQQNDNTQAVTEEALAKKKNQDACLSKIRQLMLGCKMYAIDHSDKFPKSFSDLFPGNYIGSDRSVFRCPADSNSIAIITAENADQVSSYMLFAKEMKGSSDPMTPLIIEKKGRHGKDGKGGCIAFVGGSACFVEDIEEYLKKYEMTSLSAVGETQVTEKTATQVPEKTTDTAVVVNGNNEFAFDLYAKLKDQKGNLFFSPFSISTALAMTYGGARGETAEEMAKTLHFTVDEVHLHPIFTSLNKELNGDGKSRGYQLSVANSLWGQKGYNFLPDFLKLLENNYGAEMNEADFKKAPEEARQNINKWVEKETHEKIKDLLKRGTLDESTRLVLANAIYFKGNWASQFKKDQTKDDAFRIAVDQKISVPMMCQKEKFEYMEGDDFQALKLPYIGEDLSMVIFLPKQMDGLAKLEKSFGGRLLRWLPRSTSIEVVEVYLPRFRIEKDFGLKKTLSAMGMPLAFDGDPSDGKMADFSKMAKFPATLFGGDPEAGFCISEVIHKAFVEVNEEGTEATAATAVTMAGGGSAIQPEVKLFRANHPFIFMIRDNKSGSILFMGRVVNPMG